MSCRPRRLSRRFVNGFLAGAIAWPVGGPVLLPGSKQPDLQESLQHLLLTIFSNFRSGCAIGTACLKSLPNGESTGRQLSNKIIAHALRDTNTMKSKEAVRRRIANQVRLDFAQGAVVSVDGWLLSLTEARVYALVALSSEME
jgi:hypothetical protein